MRALNCWLTAVLVAGCVGAAQTSAAQGTDSIFDSKGFTQNRDYFSASPTEHIDTLTGNLILTYTDLALPGNAGQSLRFQRTFNLKLGYWRFWVAELPLLVDRPITGSGGDPGFDPYFIDASGAEHHTSGGVTPEFWRYDRANRVLYFPDGSWVLYGSGFTPLERVDSSGNRLLVSYGANQVTVTQCLGYDALCATNRTVVLTYATQAVAGDMPTSMAFNGHTWSYVGPPGLLQSANPPSGTGPGWQYAYSGPVTSPAFSLTVTSPQGGTVQFDVEQHAFLVLPSPSSLLVDAETHDSPVVRRRVVGGRAVEPGAWSYDYTWTDQFSTLSYDTTVTAPDSSVTTYHYDYVPATVPVSPGTGPVLLSRTLKASANGADVEREQRVYTYLPDYGGLSSSPHLQQVTITRDGRNYVTTHSYHSTNYADFHRPWKTEETGELQRTTTRAFDDTLTPLFGNGQPSFVPPLRSETVEVGGQSATRTWERDPNTGFVTRETTHGLSTTFTSDGRGNVASATLGDNTQTSYTYAWGVLKDTVTRNRAASSTRMTPPDGSRRRWTPGIRSSSTATMTTGGCRRSPRDNV